MNKDQEEVFALARRGQEAAIPSDVIRDPFVLVDLKPGELAHQDLGQMQMYVDYFDRPQRTELKREREEAERVVRLAAPTEDGSDGDD